MITEPVPVPPQDTPKPPRSHQSARPLSNRVRRQADKKAQGTPVMGAGPDTQTPTRSPSPSPNHRKTPGHSFIEAATSLNTRCCAMGAQRIRFYQALRRIVTSSENDWQLAAYLSGLGRAHRKFGVQKEHFDAFRQAVAATWQRYAPEAWTDAAADAWVDLFSRAARHMIDAAERDAGQAPPWWLAEVVSDQARSADLAVLTLQPSQPVPYLPGQHVSIQMLRWPRLWRNYSIANAPREDGTLAIHVRAVPGGLVSATLVRHAAVGDTLLLGAPAGSMTVDPASQRDILCLAGGTGLAPVKAIIVAVTSAPGAGRRREIVLYFGARHEVGLYDLPDLQRLETAYPLLQVIPVVSEAAAPDAIHGTIPRVVATATWKNRDIYVSGPDEMIARTVTELKARGAPEDLIRYDRPLF